MLFPHFLIHVSEKITQNLGLKVSELYVSWQDFWNYCLHPSSRAGHMLKPTSWGSLLKQRKPSCAGSTAEVPLTCRVSNSAKCQPYRVTKTSNKKGSQHRNCLMISMCEWKLKSDASCPPKQLVFLPCWMLEERQFLFSYKSCVNVENVSSSAADEVMQLSSLPSLEQTICTLAKIVLSTEVYFVCVCGGGSSR